MKTWQEWTRMYLNKSDLNPRGVKFHEVVLDFTY